MDDDDSRIPPRIPDALSSVSDRELLARVWMLLRSLPRTPRWQPLDWDDFEVPPASRIPSAALPKRTPPAATRAARLPDGELVSTQELGRALGVSRSTIYRLGRADVTFPKPLQLSARRTGYRVERVRAWLEAKERPSRERSERPTASKERPPRPR